MPLVPPVASTATPKTLPSAVTLSMRPVVAPPVGRTWIAPPVAPVPLLNRVVRSTTNFVFAVDANLDAEPVWRSSLEVANNAVLDMHEGAR